MRSSARAQMPSGVADTFSPISPSFDATISTCSRRAPTIVISPPAIPHAMSNVPVSMRSPMSSQSTGMRSSTPTISIVGVPAPITCAPIRLSIAASSTISGSRAAFSMTVVPWARTAAVNRFSVAPLLGKSSTTRVPVSRFARASMNPWTTWISTPIAVRPRKCMSRGRLPMLSPPGIATRASPKRPTSGPSTFTDARMRVTSSYGVSGRNGPVAST